MCGIAGIFSQNKRIYPEWIKVMTDTIRHREPDDEGYLAVDTHNNNEIYTLIGDESKVNEVHIKAFKKPVNLFLGHRRLSIIDPTSSGHQPMSNDDGTVWIVYNGEINNYIELNEELKFIGYIFSTKTDPDVIHKPYEEWRKICVVRFNGTWAFVIYEALKNILFGSRDSFGVKPLYYYFDEKYFVFSSEVKSILKLPFYKPRLNEKDVFDYLAFGLREQKEDFFKNIYELFPSEAFIFDINDFRFKKWKYYNLKFVENYEKFEERKFKDYSEKIREMIFQSVRLRLKSDVPVGSCLSGVLDSSTIVCVIDEILKKDNIEMIGEKQKVFTASYEGDDVDESKWAKIVVEFTKAKWHQTFPKGDEILRDLDDLIYYQDIQFASASICAQYRVMKLAKERGVKVLLDGQGGNELFTGYPNFYQSFFKEILNNLYINTLFRELLSLKNFPVTLGFILKNLFISYGLDVASKELLPLLAYLYRYSFSLLTPHFFNIHKNRFMDYVKNRSKTLNQHLCRDMRDLKTLLQYEDRNSMRFTIESQTPFADAINLIEFVAKIPPIYKIHMGWDKALLRKSMENILPTEIRTRTDKVGFATPESKWMTENKKWIIETIQENRNLLDGFINYPKLIRDIKTDWIFRKDFTLWRILNFLMWRKVFKV